MLYASKTMTGRREMNEDSIFVPQGGEIPLVVVADGMGGHRGGGAASSIALETAVSELKKGGMGSPEHLVKQAVIKAGKTVFEAAKKDKTKKGMGTTMVLALLFNSRFIAANVGDSRLYRYADGMLKQITVDHSYVAELCAAGLITKDEAAIHPKRNLITRALGTKENESPDIYECRWKKGDIILLCSDGLYGAMTDDDIQEALSSDEEPQALCDALADKAYDNGSTDNISVIIVVNSEVA